MKENKREELITRIKTLNAELEHLLQLLSTKVKVVNSVTNSNEPKPELDNRGFMTIERLLTYSRVYLN